MFAPIARRLAYVTQPLCNLCVATAAELSGPRQLPVPTVWRSSLQNSYQ